MHRRWLHLRGALTLGTRILVTKDDSVLLVRLTYSPGWHLPGGGVDHGESFLKGARRELREECGLEAAALDLLGIYLNQLGRNADHVAVFIARGVQGEPRIQDAREIAELRYFPINELPTGLLASHRRRIQELTVREKLGIAHKPW